MDWTKEVTREEMNDLVAKYAEDGYQRPGEIELRYDLTSTNLLYSLVREYRPTKCLEFGIGGGGSAHATLAALTKNDQKFLFIGSENTDLLEIAKRTLAPFLGDQVKLIGGIEDNLKEIPDELDFIFLDPNWDKEITEWWWEHLMPKFKDGALVHIHDWSVREVDGKLAYEGGGFPGIFYLIEKYEANDWPFQKIYSVWDYEDHRGQSIASSFWIYRKPK